MRRRHEKIMLEKEAASGLFKGSLRQLKQGDSMPLFRLFDIFEGNNEVCS